MIVFCFKGKLPSGAMVDEEFLEETIYDMLTKFSNESFSRFSKPAVFS